VSHVFISYASTDFAFADRVRTGLEERGLKCWIAPRDISPGDVYADAIVQAIEAADSFVLLLSEAANESDHVFRELELASASQRRVVPVLVTGVNPSRRFRFFIASNQWLTADPKQELTWMDGLAQTLGGAEAPRVTPESTPPRAGARRPPRRSIAVAGAACVLVLLLAAGAWTLWPDDRAGGGTGDPDDIATLRRHVPFEACTAVELTQPGERAELHCRPESTGLGPAWYELYDGEAALDDRYERYRTGYGVERGPDGADGCDKTMPAETRYSTGGRENQGRLLCVRTDDGIVFVWSRYDLRIVAVTRASGSTRGKVFDWWNNAGPK